MLQMALVIGGSEHICKLTAFCEMLNFQTRPAAAKVIAILFEKSTAADSRSGN